MVSFTVGSAIDETVMTAVPRPTPTISPLLFTLATFSLLDLYSRLRSAAVEGIKVVDILIFSLTSIELFGVVEDILSSPDDSTNTKRLSLNPPSTVVRYTFAVPPLFGIIYPSLYSSSASLSSPTCSTEKVTS